MGKNEHSVGKATLLMTTSRYMHWDLHKKVVCGEFDENEEKYKKLYSHISNIFLYKNAHMSHN